MQRYFCYLVACNIFIAISSQVLFCQVSDPKSDPGNFGTSSSLSLGVGIHDLVSLNVRIRLNKENLLLTGVGYKQIFIDKNVQNTPTYTLSMGVTHFIRKSGHLNKSNKLIVLHYGITGIIAHNFGTTLEPFGRLSSTSFAIGFSDEFFFGGKQNQSFTFSIGPYFSLIHSAENFGYNAFGNKSKFLTSAYLALSYNLFLKTTK